jgi:nuclear pore complex protein Nup107
MFECYFSFEDTSATGNTFDHRAEQDAVETIKLERDTWLLLARLYQDRANPIQPGPSAEETIERNPYISPRILANRIVQNSKRLTELSTVLTWLEDTAPSPFQPDSRPPYRMNTKRRIQHNQRTGRLAPQDVTNLVKELDPDAVTRNPGSLLDPEDEAFERSLVRSIFSYVRAGKLTDSFEVCRQCNHPWLAAAMRGSLYFSWNATDALGGTDTMDTQSEGVITGNRRRRLWRDTCLAATANVCVIPPLVASDNH